MALNKSDQSPGKAKEAVSQNIQMVALELARAFRAFELYPVGHPQLKSSLRLCFDKILSEINKQGEIIFVVGREGLFYQDKILEVNLPALSQLTSELHIRQVRKFAFRKTVELREFTDFLEMLLIPAEEFRGGKKIENYFRQKRIRSLWVNEVDFGKLFIGQAGKEEEAEQEKEEAEQEQGFAYLNSLILDLDSAGGDHEAKEIIGKIEKEIEQLSGRNRLPEQWFLIGALSDFFEQKGKGFELAGPQSQALLKRFGGPNFLSWLVNNFIYSDEDSGQAFIRYFDQVGEPALKVMLERLSAPESMYFQKELINYLRKKGGLLQPMIQAGLGGRKGSPNLKLIYLLGEFRSPESANLLLELLVDSAPDVRREAIRALGKIKSKKASLELTALLREKNLDSETKLLLIQTLSEMAEIMAVPSLIALVKNRREDPEIREKAAEALGRIGSRECLSALAGVLKNPLLFRRPAPEKLQIKSAEALSRIGGERAERLLEEISAGQGIVAQYCKELLKQMRSRKGARG